LRRFAYNTRLSLKAKFLLKYAAVIAALKALGAWGVLIIAGLDAAAFGVPVYSIFRGELGAVDRALSETGRLVLIRTEDEVRLKIRPIKRTRVRQDTVREQSALSDIMTTIDNELSQIRSGHHTERTPTR